MLDIEGLKKLGFNSISLDVSGNRGEINYIDTNFDEWVEGQDYDNK